MSLTENKKRLSLSSIFLISVFTMLLLALAIVAIIQFFGGRPANGWIIDFENETDLERVEWECHNALERTESISGQGKYALRADLAPAKYPGVEVSDFPRNWEGYETFEFYFSAPLAVGQILYIRVDDSDIADEYHARYQGRAPIKGGVQKVTIPIEEMRHNPAKRLLNLRTIERIIIYLYNQDERSELILDDLRLR